MTAPAGSPERRPRSWRRAAAALFVLGVIALALLPARHPPLTARQQREQLFRELQPVTLKNCTLTRVGSVNDGGYLMCANLFHGAEAVYSYGIGPADDWGCEISDTRRIPVHQYDCFSPPHQGCSGGRSSFHDECVGPKRQRSDARLFDTIANQIARNGDGRKTLIMKIDIEGAEVASVMATSDRIFSRVDQLAMEIHGVTPEFLDLVRKLKRSFHVVHLHYNNQACSNRYKPFPAWAYQVLLVSKRIAVVDPDAPPPSLPRPLDASDYPLGHECQTPWPIEPE